MDQAKEKLLFDAHPHLYRDVHDQAPMTESLMGFGCECGDGWYKLLWDLSDKLEPMIEQFTKEHPEIKHPPRVVQVKEKFGTLRFYMSSETGEMDKAIAEAERESAKTCESCGNEGSMCVRGGWYQTLCPCCAEKHEYKVLPKEESGHDT